MTSELPDPGSASEPPAPEPGPTGRLRLPVAVWVALWIAAWTAVALLGNLALHGAVNGLHAALAVFLTINVAICYWEMCLLWRIDRIEERHRRRLAGERRPSGGRRGSFFLAPVPLAELGSRDLWSQVWSEYAIYDPSYADRRSFGFAIDVGNGFSTIVPSLVFFVGMTVPILSPVVLGIVGLLVFWQKFYGTLLYFFTYVFNRRYAGKSAAAVATFVGGVNGIWLVGPALGLFACLRLILDGSFGVLR